MADLRKTIQILFEGEERNVTGVISGIDKGLTSITTPAADAVKAIAKLDAALAALAVGGLAYAYKKSVDYESAVIDLKKVVGDSPKEMEAAKAASLSLSGAYGEGATKILASTANFKQAGFEVQESIKLTKNAMDLKIAGDVSAAESSEYLISILKGFKAPATEATRVVDILNEVSNKYATNVQQLAIGMADLSPIAKTMGFNFEETAGLLTPVIEVFRSGSGSAMALKTGLLKLIDDAEPVQKALKSIGVAQKDSSGALRSGKDILLDVSRAFQNLAEPQKLFVTQQLVGIDQSARMVEVFNGLSKSLEITKVALGATGSAQQEVSARLASSEVIINRLGVAFENFARVVGDKYKDAVTKAIAGGVDLEDNLRGLADSKTFDPFLKRVEAMATQIGIVIRNIAKAAPQAFNEIDFSKLLKSLDEVANDIGKLFDIDTSNPKELAKTVQTLIDSISSLIDVSRGIGEAFVPVLDTAKATVKAFNSLDEATKSLAGNIIGAAAAYKLFGPVIGTIMFTIGQDAKTMESVMKIAFAGIEADINLLILGFETLAYTVSMALLQIMEVSAKIPGSAMTEDDLRPMREWVSFLEEKMVDAAWNIWGAMDKISKSIADSGSESKTAKSKVQEYIDSLNKIPDKKKTTIDVNINDKASTPLKSISAQLAELSPPKSKKTIDIITTADGMTIEKAWGMVIEKFPDGSTRIVQAKTTATGIDEAKKKVDEIPGEKKIDIEAKIETERLKAQSDVIQSSIEWKAKVDISQIEAGTEKVKAMFSSIDNTITSTGNLMGDMLGSYKTASSGSSVIYDQIQKESQRRDDAIKTQKDLANAEVANLNARTALLKQGKALIEVQAKGLQPHLEAFMFEILKGIQVRATSEGANFLLGLTTSTVNTGGTKT